ncbi:hypothetical protein [Salmonella phage S124]|uniref:Uncharacterized protein n=1 Tax=Salmonella phage S124 TaxID=2231351 RepID=A0A2Z5HTT1_9CAUD|nr:hypothetical protein HOT67_gp095 [Salmonella phage S124]AXC43188.1 hypothetical protein [Salmonella phage S124]
MTLFAQQPIKIVADHELDSWDYTLKDLTATIQFKSIKMYFLHTDLQGCKDFESKLIDARKIFGTARIPADNLINALIDAGYKLVKTEVNRPSTTSMQIPSLGSGYITAMTNSDKRLMSDMHNVKCGGNIEASTPYKIGEDCSITMSFAKDRVAPSDSGVSSNGNRSSYTVYLSNPSKEGELERVLTEAFAAIDQDRYRSKGL